MSEESVPPEEKSADAWGQPISAERQAQLQWYLDQWAAESDHGARKGPFEEIALSGSDISWLEKQFDRDMIDLLPDLHLEGAILHWAKLEGANLSGVHLEGADLFGAHLEKADLRGAHLEKADLSEARLEGAELRGAHLEGVDMSDANLAEASLSWTHLEGADLSGAHIEGSSLFRAHLEGANLLGSYLEGTDLSETHLERAVLQRANLAGANLRNAWMDKTTLLNNAILDKVSLDQLSFDGVNLAVVKWERKQVRMLGDELKARARTDEHGARKSRERRLDDYEAAVRAHLQLAAVLRSQGMSEQADRFAYRALILQRARYRLQRRYGQWLFSWVLFFLAGYGYRPARSLFWYLAVIAGFAVAYFSVGYGSGLIPGPIDAAVFSVTSFHGRGFFPNEAVSLHHPLTILAALEAVIGLFIEISFIATFTQRYFGAR